MSRPLRADGHRLIFVVLVVGMSLGACRQAEPSSEKRCSGGRWLTVALAVAWREPESRELLLSEIYANADLVECSARLQQVLLRRDLLLPEGAISAFQDGVEELVRQAIRELDEERRKASAGVDVPDELSELATKCEGGLRDLVSPRRDI